MGATAHPSASSGEDVNGKTKDTRQKTKDKRQKTKDTRQKGGLAHFYLFTFVIYL